MTLTRARTLQYIGILLSLGIIAVGYWYFSARAGVKTNTSALQPQGVGDLSAGLAAYFRFDETTGSSTADSSTNGSNGTLNNMENGDWVAGQIGNGLDFDGSNEYISVPNSTALQSVSQFSVSVWINPDTTSGTILGKQQYGLWSGWTLGFGSTSGSSCSGGQIAYTFGPGWGCTTLAPVTSGSWQHIVMAFNGSTISFYRNGVLVQTFSSSAPATVSSALFIGNTFDNGGAPGGSYFDGRIDEVRIYHRGLSADEVGNLYRTTAPTGVDTSLKGYWSFNGEALSGTTAYDWSGAGNNGTLTNGPIITKGQVGQALSFDGTDDYVVGTAAATADVFTYSAWINPSTNSGTIIGTTSNGIQWRLSTGKLNLVAAGVTEIGSSTETVPMNAWTHVSLTNDASGNYTFYINGHDAGGRGTNAYNYDNQRPAIGSRYHDNASELFTGIIDEVRIYNRALTAAEIKSLYNRGAPDKTNAGSSQAQGTGRLDSDLRAYYPLDNGSGTTATDASTNGNNGTLTNGPTWTTGQIGGAVSFDGSDDYIGLPAKVFGIMPKGTASFWVKGTNYTAGQHFIYEEGASFNNFAAVWPSSSSSSMTLNVGGNTAINTTKTNFSTGTWYQIAISWDGTTANVYVDGALDKSVAHGYSPSTTNGGLPQIGRYLAGGSGGGYFNGSVDEFRVYARVLSAEDIAELYRLVTPTGTDTSLKGYWSFNGKDMNGTTTAYDRSGLGSNGTLTNGPAITNSVIGQGLSFDGTNDYVDLGASTPYQFANTTFTVTGWFKSGPSDTGGVFVSQGGHFTSGGWFVGLNGDTTGKLSGVIKNSDTGQTGQLSTRTGFNDNNWHQFAFVMTTNTSSYASNNILIYADGMLQSSTVNSDSTSGGYSLAPQTAKIGTRYTASDAFFAGSLDEVRIYNRALTAAEIQSQYDTVKPEKINSSATQAQGVGRLDSGLAGYWKLDEGSGTSAGDSSTSGTTGTLTNGPTWATGRIGGAVTFDGTNDYIQTSVYTPYQFADQTFTVAGWFKTTSTIDPTYIIAQGGCTGGWLVRMSGATGSLTAALRGAGSCGSVPAIRTTASTGLNDGSWHHFAAVVTTSTTTASANTMTLYIDGALNQGSLTQDATVYLPVNSWIVLASRDGGLDQPFQGSLDEMRVYNRGLSADEISQLYRLSTPTGTDTSLKGYWSFNGKDVSGTTAYDRSGAGYVGTLVSGPSVINGKLGQGLSFDGVDDYVNLLTVPSALFTNTTFTLTGWFKSSSSASQGILSQDHCNGGWFVRLESGTLSVSLRNSGSCGGGSASRSSAATNLANGTWHHFATVITTDTVTAGNNNVVIYIDGALNQGSLSAGQVYGSAGDNKVQIGTRYSGDQLFSGSIDEVRIYNRALTAAEVLGLYNQSR